MLLIFHTFSALFVSSLTVYSTVIGRCSLKCCAFAVKYMCVFDLTYWRICPFPVKKGHLPRRAIFPLNQRWPAVAGTTVIDIASEAMSHLNTKV